MTKTNQQRIANLYSECKTPEELARLKELEIIYADEVIGKLSTIWIVVSKVDKIYHELMEVKYGKN